MRLGPWSLAAALLASCATTQVPRGADFVTEDGDPVVLVDDKRLVIEAPVGTPAPDDEATLMWVRRSALMIEDYFGRFSVPSIEVELYPGGVSGVSFGIHYGGRRVRLFPGVFASAAELERDKILLHELLHTAFPMVERRHRWMREGLSTYLETILRARAGVIDEEAVWKHFERQMRLGLPKGGRGLDASRTWATKYWGGALFWMLADVRIREATLSRPPAEQRSLQDALRAILADDGTSRASWEVDRVLDVGDEATGTRVLHDLYDEMARRPIALDLTALYAELGVVRTESGAVRLNDDARLAAVRRAMTEQTLELPPIPR